MVLIQSAQTPVLTILGRPTGYAAATQNGEIAADRSRSITHEFVEIDLTAAHDCYNLPVAAKVAQAIRNTFGEDDDRVPIAPRRGNAGIWRIESSNLDPYRAVKELVHEGVSLGTVTIKSESITVKEDGHVMRKFERSPHDLLITLRDADSHLLRHVSNEEIISKIVDMGIGKIKKSVQRQIRRESGEYTGNKFFVLENVKPEERGNIPDCFVFEVPNIGKLKMWLNHRHQLRKCGYCGEKHDAICQVREKVNALVSEREQIRAKEGVSVKTYSDSTLRYANQTSLKSDIDAMSGGTMGNLMNAIGVDTQNVDTPNVIIVAGANDKKMNVSPPQYISSLKTIRERVADLVKSKENVAVLIPPKPLPDSLLSPEDTVKEEIFDDHVKEIATLGVKVWSNPIDRYEEDWGLHPSITQTAELLEYINQRVLEDFKTSYLLPSTSIDVLALPNKYWNVTSLYKYGCAACGSKTRNRWSNICDDCKAAADSSDVTPLAEDFERRVATIMDAELPMLSSDDADEIRCEQCEVIFHEIKDLRQHFAEEHPENEPKFKRGKLTTNQKDGKKGRRVKSTPTKSV